MSVAGDRRLRVTADDFGFSPGVTDGILHSFEHGIVTHTSLMPGGLDFTRAAALAVSTPGLGVGVHLTLTWGRSETAAATLTRPDGDFLPLSVMLRRAVCGRLSSGDVLAEWRAQVEKVIAAGVRPTHLDSHHHVHLLPACLTAAVSLARDFRIPWVRRPVEPFVFLWSSPLRMSKVAAMSVLCRRPWPTSASDSFRGLALQGRTDFRMALSRTLRRIPAGHTELMVHPGRADALLATHDAYVHEREVELQTLCTPEVRELLDEERIALDRP